MINGNKIYMNKSQADLLTLLEREQEKSGFISREFTTMVAQSLEIPLSDVFGVISFYSFLTDKPQGRNIIRICKSLPCSIKQAEIVKESIVRELGIKPGQTTADGRFTFTMTNCIGACDKAPAMMINNDIYGELTPQKITNILQSYK